MAIDKVRQYFKQWNIEDRIMEKEVSSATVELAAEAVGCIPARIAKSLSFKIGDEPILVVTAGDTKVDNKKYKGKFKVKAKMLDPDEVKEMIGHSVGGVCPFGIKPEVKVYLDESMKRFETVFPACGSNNSMIELTCEELEKFSCSKEWIDVCKLVGSQQYR